MTIKKDGGAVGHRLPGILNDPPGSSTLAAKRKGCMLDIRAVLNTRRLPAGKLGDWPPASCGLDTSHDGGSGVSCALRKALAVGWRPQSDKRRAAGGQWVRGPRAGQVSMERGVSPGTPPPRGLGPGTFPPYT